jgi:hypothetical protein
MRKRRPVGANQHRVHQREHLAPGRDAPDDPEPDGPLDQRSSPSHNPSVTARDEPGSDDDALGVLLADLLDAGDGGSAAGG